MTEIDDFIPARSSDPVTSHLTDALVRWRSGSQRVVLLAVYPDDDSIGLTDDEAQTLAGVDPMSNYWKRCSELRAAGLIAWTGEIRLGRADMPRMVCSLTVSGRTAQRHFAAMSLLEVEGL